MKIPTWLNPWARIRQLERDNDYLADRLEYEREEMDWRISRMIRQEINAVEYRYTQMRAMNEALMKNAADIHASTPSAIFALRKGGEQ